jgi:CRP-like cAMP-binding protein
MFSTTWALENFIGRLGSLSPLSPDDVTALLALKGEPARLRSNVDIVSPGEAFDYACLVVSGIVARYIQLRDGQRQFTAFHMPGDIADIHRVAAPSAGSALQALGTATIVRVPARDLRSVALASPSITQAFWAYAAADAAVLAQWAVNIARRDAKSRMAHFLCEIGIRSEYSGLGSREDFILEASQTQIGDALGLTTVHVNRTLKTLRESNVLAVERPIVRISNWPALAAIGDFDPAYLQLDQRLEAA